MINYLYPPGTITRGHVERLNKHSYLAVLQTYSGNAHDSFEIHAIDPHHARERSEAFCSKLGTHLELEISQHVKAIFLDDMTEIQADQSAQVKPEFFHQERRIA